MSEIDPKAKYEKLMRDLLPPGKAWRFMHGGQMLKLLNSFALEMARIDGRAEILIEESDPRKATELITEWEGMVGLPDSCSKQVAETIEERRGDVHARLIARDNQTAAYIKTVAAAAGFDVEIVTFRPSMCGLVHCGMPIAGPEWVRTFHVIYNESTSTYFAVGENSVGDSLVDFRNQRLECLIERIKPAHVAVIYTYTE